MEIMNMNDVMASWQALDLVNVQYALDEQAMTIATSRESSLNSRNQLAAKTKEFRRAMNDPASPSKQDYRSLMKSYQTEVDALNTRAKFAENCFLSLYRIIRQAPDPSEAMAILCTERQNALSDIASLKKSLEAKSGEYELVLSDYALLKNKIAQEEAKSFDTIVDAKLVEMQESHREQIQSLHVQYEEELSALQQQLENSLVETEKAFDRNMELEQQMTLLREQRACQHNSTGVDESQMAVLSDEIAGLQEALKNEAIRMNNVTALHAKTKRILEEELANKTKQLGIVSAKADGLESLVKQQQITLEISVRYGEQLRTIYNAIHDGSECPHSLINVEKLIVERIHQLQDECFQMKRKVEDQNDALENLQEKEARTMESLRDQVEITKKLDRDIQERISLAVHGNVSTEHSLSNILEQESSNRALTTAQNMVAVIIDQRNRLLADLRSKEDTIEKLKVSSGNMESKIQSLSDDNLQLYERIRFLQNFKASDRSTLLAQHSGPDVESQSKPIVRGLGQGVEHRYKDLYELESNPLMIFKKSETDRAMRSLSRWERPMVRLFNFVLSQPRGRVALAGYLALLHITLILIIF